MSDLYQILGVSRNASAATIKRRFRKLAMKLHPDRGGDAAEFDAMKQAYDILSDPERRARYDATGDTAKPEASQSPAYLRLNICLGGILANYLASGAEPAKADLLAAMRNTLCAEVSQANADRRPFAKCLHNLRAVLGRFQADSDNYLEVVVKQKIQILEADLALRDKNIKEIGEALEILKLYTYTPESPAQKPPRDKPFWWITQQPLDF